MLESKEGKQVVYAKNRAEWREWLRANSQFEKSVWLILQHKKSKIQGINLNDATEEALCFGWIDSISNKRDTESTYQRFSPRKANSNWSPSNIERVERLAAAGLMTEHGQKLIDLAKQQGRWNVEKEK